MIGSQKVTSSDIVALLNAKYEQAGRYTVLEQLCNGTGSNGSSWIDVGQFDNWPSDGCTRRAFEIKVSRSDFLSELKKLMKNEWARKAFHEFWFVAPSGVIKEEELMAGIGLMEVRGAKLCVVRHAARNADAKINDSMMCSWLRTATKACSTITDRIVAQRIANDQKYLDAQKWVKAVQSFLRKRGAEFESWLDEPAALQRLEDAANGKELSNIRDRVSAILDKFQEKMISFVEVAELLANVGILATNEANEEIIHAYGDCDYKVMDSIKANIKNKKRYDMIKLKNKLDWMETLTRGQQ